MTEGGEMAGNSVEGPQELLRIERDLALALSDVGGLDDGLQIILEAVCRIQGIDCGGVYIVHPTTHCLDLVSTRGLPEWFVSKAQHYEPDDAEARVALAGAPVYTSLADMTSNGRMALASEGLRGLAVLPVAHRGDVVAVLNVSSHTHADFPQVTRDAVEGITALVAAVVARMRADQRLREEHEFRTAVISKAAEGLCVFHRTEAFPHLVFTEWNGRMSEITGHSMADVNRNGWDQALYPDASIDESRCIFAATLAGGEPLHGTEREIIRADGQRRTVCVSSSVIELQGGEHVLLHVLDVTDRVAATRLLEEHKQVLEHEVHQRTAQLQATNWSLSAALDKVKVLKGLLPICASCKKIRGTDEHWYSVEEYVTDHAEVEFTHGVCPTCEKKALSALGSGQDVGIT